ncbi:Sensor histidine kinase [hydrothermal vent metagenome]|uniref:Sensor histidine kinase n=1 Tax=hydrothermal vent metagenome TaxID=652676 RepID=A0A3B1C574_9ZZZZ
MSGECDDASIKSEAIDPEIYLKALLDDTIETITRAVSCDACAILLIDQNQDTMTVKAQMGFHDSILSSVRLPKGSGICWRLFNERRPVSVSKMSEEPDFLDFPGSGIERYQSLLGIHIEEGDEFIGAICIHNIEPRGFTESEISKLQKISERVSGAIKTAWSFERLREETRVLSFLQEMTHLVNSTNEIGAIANHVTAHTNRLTGARETYIWLVGPSGDPEELLVSGDNADDGWLKPVREGPAREAVRIMESIKIDDIASSRFDGLERVAKNSMILCPMIFNNKVKGVILLADRVTGLQNFFSPFTSEEARTLSYIAQTAAQAIDRAQTNLRLESALDRNSKNVRELSILFQLSMATKRALKLGDLLRVILSCVTVGEGLGFNRSIIFMVNENNGILEGKMGLGPDSGNEAERIWNKIDKEEVESYGLVEWLINRDPYEVENSGFHHMALTLGFPLSDNCAITRAIAKGSAVNVDGDYEMTAKDMECARILGCARFAVVPLVARDKPTGAILVDNLYNDKPITGEQIALLTRFAIPAAWAIENIKLVERLSVINKELFSLDRHIARVERLSALGEVTAEMAHEIRNPLVSIGGFARLLNKEITDLESAKKYAAIILEKTEKLESLLENTLSISRETPIKKERADINQIVRETMDFHWSAISEKGIETMFDLDPHLKEVNIDHAHIRQVIINLLLNAIEAMSCMKHSLKKTITIKTLQAPGQKDHVQIRIGDTGGGIAKRDCGDVFSPFFTTKPDGTGLGLSLCKKLVHTHHGSIEIDNKPGDGVTFTITLPCD